nr:rhamnogalacturonan lyase [Arthrobacter sp. RIT-PI-e]
MVSFVRPRRSRGAVGVAAVAAVAAATLVSVPAAAALQDAPGGVPGDALVRQVEYLDRAPVAVTTEGGVYVGWRMLGLDAESIGFHVYRDGVRITDTPVTGSTNFLDVAGTGTSVYRVTALMDHREVTVTEEFTPWGEQSLDIPLQRPAGGTTPSGEAYEYEANDASVGDVDGDGEYEIILKWNPTNAKDNSRAGYTGNVYVDAYKLDGTRLWQIDLGRNIRAGAHYTQFQVFDYDGDGRAEIAMKTADATVDGAGTVIGDAAADHRNAGGYVLTGPEYLTVFEGATGAALDTIDYVPERGTLSSWGDTYGNRMDRFLAGTAYLNGENPSMIFSRGYYTKTYIAAFDFVDGKIQERWLFDSTKAGNQYAGQGNHELSIADVDSDGADEIVFGSMTIDDDGTPLYTTGLGHGDAMHVTDHMPWRDGLEVYSVHESMPSSGQRAATMRDAATGEILWSIPGTRDTGRGAVGDIDPTHEGNEAWAIGGTYKYNSKIGSLRAADGTDLGTSIPAANFLTWWDGDLLREITDHDYTDPTEMATGATPTISKWNWESKTEDRLLTLDGTLTGNGTKGNPVLQADLFGDWREELIYRTADNSALRIFTTTDVTEHRIRTLMHDPVYRLGVAWQNTAYNQPPHTSFFLGEGMDTPPAPSIAYVNAPAPDETAPVVTGIKDTKVGAKRGLTVDVQAEDPESGIRSLSVIFNGTELTGVNGRYELPIAGLKGSFELRATAVNHAGLETTTTAEITVRPGNGKAH